MSLGSWWQARRKARRVRVRARSLVGVGLKDLDAFQFAESVEWLQEDAASLADAIAAADPLTLRMAVANCLTHAALFRDVAEHIEQQLLSSERRYAVAPE